MNRLCASSSWASTSGAMNANGRLREPNGKNGTCTRAAVPIRYSAMARSAHPRRRTNRLTTTLTTRTTPSRQWAATTVAHRTSYRGDPMTQRPVEMRSDVLCYTSAPLETALEVTGPHQSRHLRRYRLHRHGLDRQTGRCIAHRGMP